MMLSATTPWSSHGQRYNGWPPSKLRKLRVVWCDMLTQTEHCYIVKDDSILGAEPIIKGTRTPVRAVVELWRLGYAPEEIPRDLPHLTLAAVFDALSYYSDHQSEINAHIEANRVPDDLVDPRFRG